MTNVTRTALMGASLVFLPVLCEAQVAYLIGTVAGGGLPQPGPAVSAALAPPVSVAVDVSGNVYFSDDNCVFKVDTAGVLARVAGASPAPGYSGDMGPATSAQLYGPAGVAVDSAGNLYIADAGNHRIRKVAAGIITTVAGNGTPGYSGDNGQAMSAQLYGPAAVALDSAGNLYIADAGNRRIRKVAAGTNIITTVAGSGGTGYSGDNGPATSAQFRDPEGVAVDSSGNLYIADWPNNTIRKVADGIITTVAGNGTQGYSGDNGPATNAQLDDPFAVAVDGSGNLYIAGGNAIRKVAAGTNIITTVAGNGTTGFSGDGSKATSAQLDDPFGVAVDGSGNLYVADSQNNRIRAVTAATGLIATVAGNGTFGYSGDNGPATSAQLDKPNAVAVDGSGSFYIADSQNNRIREVAATTGTITTVAGNGTSGYSGDHGPATGAQLAAPNGVAVDGFGNLYIADTGNSVVRKVAATGVITTVAGNGGFGYSGDQGLAINAQLDAPRGVAVDGSGNLYIADTLNNRIREVAAATGIITTVAGNGTFGYAGDTGPAISAELENPSSVAVDGLGNLYIADTLNERIREVAAGIITTVAGNGTFGDSGDGEPAASAQFADPEGVAVDSSGDLYIADSGNQNVRKVAAGTITTLAGTGTNTGNSPYGVAVGLPGQVYIAEAGNNVVTLVNDSGAPQSEITANNATSSDHLTFNLLIQNSIGIPQTTAALESMPSTSTIAAQPAALAAAASSTSGTAVVGGTVQFTQTLATDPSLPNASNVVVGSSLPPTWTITGCTSDGGGTCSATGGSAISLSYPVIAASQPPSYTLTADGPAGDSVLVSSSATTGASASQFVAVSPGAAFALSFAAPTSTVPAGLQIGYSLNLTNNGSGPKLNGDPLTVTIMPDAALTNVCQGQSQGGSWGCTPVCSNSGAPMVCTDSSLVPAGGSTSLTVSGIVPQSAAGLLSTSATLTFGGQVSAPVTASSTVITGPPTAVTALSPVPGATGVSTAASLTWEASAQAASYNVYFGVSTSPPLVIGTSATSYSPSMSPGITYYWSVTAVNALGSTPSAVWSFTTGAAGPAVVNVTSSTANGTYTTGASVSIQVGFSEVVTVTGMPALALNSGGTANYGSGSGSATLTFIYTVSAGDTSAHLDYASAGALAVNGATVKDASGNNANLTLSPPGTPGSLGANTSIVINPAAANVTDVTSSIGNGTYTNQSIPIQVTFSGPVTVIGTPLLTLNSGGMAAYTSGSGNATLIFIYPIGATDSSSHLDYTSTGAMTLNGGTVKGAAGNNANLTLPAPGAPGSLGYNTDIVIGSAPNQCEFSISASSAQLPSGSGLFLDTASNTGVFLSALTGTFTLSAKNCGAGDLWTATSNNVPILAVAKGAFAAGMLPSFSIGGNGSTASTVVGFAMFANTTGGARTGSITISGTEGGQPFSLAFTATEAASGDPILPGVVRALYQTILGREPDSGGFTFWTTNGAPQDANGNILENEMADDFYRSAEFMANGWSVMSIYQAVLGNSPTYSQWIAGVTPLRPGAPSPALVENLLDTLTGPISNTAFVQLVIQNSWGRSATPAEVTQYAGQLNASSSPTARLDFLNSTVLVNPLFTNATNPAWVNVLYYTILVRDPDPAGFSFWVQSATNPPGQPGIYYVPVGPAPSYQTKLYIIGQAAPPNPSFLGFLGSPEFQALIQGSPGSTVQVNLAASFNRTGIYSDGMTFNTGIDGQGFAYSASLLSSAETWNGVLFNLGPANVPDVVSANNNVIALPAGQFSTMMMLAIGVNGPQPSQTVTVTYTDGSNTSFVQSFSDWIFPQGYTGESVASVMSYRNMSNGSHQTVTTNLYGYSFPLNSSKTVASVTLPGNSNLVVLAATLSP